MYSWQKFVAPLAGAVLVVAAYQLYEWRGVALAATAMVTWLLWQFSRFLQIMRRAAKRPLGHVASATALQAKLKPGMPLLNVIAMAQSLGRALTPAGQQPEVFAWSDDDGQTELRCTFQDGRLLRWAREAATADQPPASP
jgi:hypothetical protein